MKQKPSNPNKKVRRPRFEEDEKNMIIGGKCYSVPEDGLDGAWKEYEEGKRKATEEDYD